MCIVTGAVTILCSFVGLACMPSDPASAKGFDERERHIAISRVVENNTGARCRHEAQMREAICDIKFWLLFSTVFLIL